MTPDQNNKRGLIPSLEPHPLPGSVTSSRSVRPLAGPAVVGDKGIAAEDEREDEGAEDAEEGEYTKGRREARYGERMRTR